MLTLPVKNRRKKQPYLAIRSRLFAKQIPKQAQLFLPELRSFMKERGIKNVGPSFLRYNTIDAAGEMDVEFGFFTDKLYAGSGPIRAGILPGGSFMSVTWSGPYNKMTDVDAMLIGWGNIKGVPWDCVATEAGLFYGCRIEIHHASMLEDVTSGNWVTEAAIMVKAQSGEH
jgi:hypothetical protein